MGLLKIGLKDKERFTIGDDITIEVSFPRDDKGRRKNIIVAKINAPTNLKIKRIDSYNEKNK